MSTSAVAGGGRRRPQLKQTANAFINSAASLISLSQVDCKLCVLFHLTKYTKDNRSVLRVVGKKRHVPMPCSSLSWRRTLSLSLASS
ncbi:hypothetical protein EVAR_35378_1 [Eumeta japonica]|uniref:Uncharacterized protein n=1 Tax=Eumeta variegata TaxID=151549 RepID=A0A4C1XAH4_EUMVA|nr:hypothetical protein EVAR_35378_1 [Eumeta japonica]